jgi:predicted amidophosphoribosyltransferase
MLCTDCKKQFPKWKKTTAVKWICMPCMQKRRREREVANGRRPSAKQAWAKHQKELAEAKEYAKHKEDVDAITAWLDH